MAYLGANSVLKNTLIIKAKKDITVPFSFCAKFTRAIMKGNDSLKWQSINDSWFDSNHSLLLFIFERTENYERYRHVNLSNCKKGCPL